MGDKVSVLWEGNYEPYMVAIYVDKYSAHKAAIALRWSDWVDAFEFSRRHGKRERFDEMFGHWWDENPRRFNRYYVREMVVLS